MRAMLPAALLMLLIADSDLRAQQAGPQFSLEGAGFYATVNGDDFEGTDAGFGFEAQGRLTFTAFSIGAGFQRSSHDLDEVSDNLIVTGFFAEPRYAFPATSGMVPYITGRIARVTQKLETDVPDYGSAELESSGFLFGGGMGLQVPMSPVASFNVSAMYSRVSFGDVEVDGQEIADSDSEGSSVILRFGIGFAFGGR